MVTQSVIRNNTAKYYGGGICFWFGQLTMINCNITNNLAENKELIFSLREEKGGGLFGTVSGLWNLTQ